MIAAAEEERFERVKHWSGLPLQSIQFCLDQSGVDWRQVEIVSINSDPSAHQFKKLFAAIRYQPSISLVSKKLKNRKSRNDTKALLIERFGDHPGLQFKQIEHHLCHLASAFYPSGFDKALVLSVDGFGDFSSCAWGVGEHGKLTVKGYRHFPHSLGIFYQAMTQFLGFRKYGDEYKVMGLAPYGEPRFKSEMKQILRFENGWDFQLDLEYFLHHLQNVEMDFTSGSPVFSNLFSEQTKLLLGDTRSPEEELTQAHKDLASSIQHTYQECFLRMVTYLKSLEPCSNLALAGGCAMNSVANGKIRETLEFDGVYIQPAAGDAGGAIGAALMASENLSSGRVSSIMPTAYLGPTYSSDQIQSLIDANKESIDEAECKIDLLEEDEIYKKTVEVLLSGGVVGWFQGAMEWGARALGNRSILADPTRSDMKDILNSKIKRRESFRPFAPSILREHVGQWFEIDDDVPYMQKVYKIKQDKRQEIPAVCHVDGTGRLQTVTSQSNPRYYGLISRFHEITKVPMLLNTSFNENEPIVCSPQEALDCFLRTKMDLLVMNNHLISRI